jgi:hypothetical protein
MPRRYSRRYFLWYGSATFGTSMLLKACASSPLARQKKSVSNSTAPSSSPVAATDTKKDFKVAMVLPGIITDKA